MMLQEGQQMGPKKPAAAGFIANPAESAGTYALPAVCTALLMT